MNKLSAEKLIKIPVEEREKYYKYPFRHGLNCGEVTDYEVKHRIEYRNIWGKGTHIISHQCPNCGSKDTEWLRNEFNICYSCETSFKW